MPVMCIVHGCEGIFLNRSNLNRHMRNVHNLKSKHVSYDQSVWSYKCLEKYCNASFQQNQGLVTHLEEEHNLKFDFVEVSVTRINEFHAWKSAIEKEYQCSYIFKSKTSSTNGEVTSYYNCNRSRTGAKARDKSKQYYRLLKSQGSCKMKSSCTSQIKVINKDGNDILIRWQKIHYGHDIQLEHLRLQKEDHQNIASKLITGVTSARILATIRDDIQKHLKRIDLLTPKDIDNIKASFNVHIKDGKRHENDAVSVDCFIKLNKFCGEQKSDYASKKVEENNSFLSTLDESENISNTDVKLKNIIDATFSKLNTVDLKRLDGDVIQQIHYHLNVINSLSVLPKYDSSLKATTTDVHTGKKKQKRIISPQPRFLSTKKKRNHRKSTYQKPSNKEVSSIGKALVDRPDLFISTSASNDHMY